MVKHLEQEDMKQSQITKAKQLAQQRRNLKMQTMSETDRHKEQQRLTNLETGQRETSSEGKE